jgi:hypothetical protein
VIAQQQHGIVLQFACPHDTYMFLFDAVRGVIKGYRRQKFSAISYSPGTLVSYTIQQKFRYVVSDMRLMQYPSSWIKHDIWFIHHVIEIVTHFLAIEMPSPDVFSFLIDLYQSDKPAWVDGPHGKLAFLCRLFVLLGIYPDHVQFSSQFSSALFGDDWLSVRASQNEQEMKMWIQACMRTHPYEINLKTTQYITQLESHGA